MVRKKLLAFAATASLGIAGYTTLDAATLYPLPDQAGYGVTTYFVNATETFFDYFEEGQPRKDVPHSIANRQTIPMTGTLFSSDENEGPSTLGMVLASLGMMAIIIHRRRDI